MGLFVTSFIIIYMGWYIVISLKFHVLEGINKDDFINLFEKHNEIIGRIESLKYDLKSSTENFEHLNDNLLSFTFQHDFVHRETMRGHVLEYPYFHLATFWIAFLDKTYLFASGEDSAIGYILDEIKRIVADNMSREIVITPLKINNEVFTEVLVKDALDISNSWFEEVDEGVRAAFLSGHLKDSDSENELYGLFKEKAGNVNSTTFMSRKLGYTITISRIKGSIYSPNKKANPLGFIGYFQEVIYPILNTT